MKEIKTLFHQKKIVVMGLGVTGISVTKKLLELGNNIVAFDNNTCLDKEAIYSQIGDNCKDKLEIILAEDSHFTPSIIENSSFIIMSPGISSDNMLYRSAIKTGIPIWDEIELSWNFLGGTQKANTIAVTGTNGKTTVVSLIGKVLMDSAIPTEICGNVGSPVINTFNIDKESGKAFPDDIIRVIEISSFQLERTYTFNPRVGVLLNITSDHVDRHGSMEEYTGLKMKLFSKQGPGDYAIVNLDDQVASRKIEEIKNTLRANIIRYGLKKRAMSSIWEEDKNIYCDFPFFNGKINIKNALLQGSHNISNIMAATAASLIAGVKPKNIERSIKSFKPLGHRMEYLGRIAGIRCINDSKATNPDSVAAALRDFTKEVTIIMGGKDKNMDFKPLLPLLISKANNIILIGETASYLEKLLKNIEGAFNVYRCQMIEEAVELGFKVTFEGQVLMLSPGCASMDMFRDYKDRGDRFKKAVMAFKES